MRLLLALFAYIISAGVCSLAMDQHNSTVSNCITQSMMRCFYPAYQTMKNQYHRLRRTSHLEFNKQDFNSMCDVMESDVSYCMERIDNSCGETARQSALKELNTTFNYFCYSGWKDYQKFQKCYTENKLKVKERIRKCYTSSNLNRKNFFEHEWEYGNRDFRNDYGNYDHYNNYGNRHYYHDYDHDYSNDYEGFMSDDSKTGADATEKANAAETKDNANKGIPEPTDYDDNYDNTYYNNQNYNYRHWSNKYDRKNDGRSYYDRDNYGRDYYGRSHGSRYPYRNENYDNRNNNGDRYEDGDTETRWKDSHGNDYYTRSYERLNREAPADEEKEGSRPEPEVNSDGYRNDRFNYGYGRGSYWNNRRQYYDRHNYKGHDNPKRRDISDSDSDSYNNDDYNRHYNRDSYNYDGNYNGNYDGNYNGNYDGNNGGNWYGDRNSYYRHDMGGDRPEYWAFYNYDIKSRSDICTGMNKMRTCSHEMKTYCNHESDMFMYNLNNMMYQFGRLFMNCDYTSETPAPMPASESVEEENNYCNHRLAIACIQPFQSWFYSFKENEMRMLADSDTLRNMCRVMQSQIFPCISRETASCNDHFQYPFNIFMHSFSYLCKPEILQDVVKHSDCWRGHSANVTYSMCKQLMQSKMEHYYDRHHGDMMRYTCGLMAEFQSCVHMMDCKEAARDFANAFMERAMQPARTYFKCDGSEIKDADSMKTMSWYEYLPQDIAIDFRNNNVN